MVTGGRASLEPPVYGPGAMLAGKYRIERTLGVGGFGIVLAAIHEQLEERVAIKLLLPEAAAHPTAASRFVREARAAAKIRSEHVARVKDVGQLEDGTPFMVMEYLEGEDLSAVIKRAGPQAVPDVCEWILQATEALAEAHGLGMVHRDLKPANLFLARRIDGAPCVKVLDFGISKLATEPGAADKGMTKTSDVMGSPFYMSPEQMRSTRDVDARADIWALGAILFELLAGNPPFDAETMTGLIVSIMQESPRDLAAYRRDVPPELRSAILTCLQKDAGARWQDVLQLANAIAPFAPPRAHASLARIAAALGAARSAQAPASQVGASSQAGGQPYAMTAIPSTVQSAAAPAVTGGAASGEWARSVAVRRQGPSAAVWIGVVCAAIAVLGGGAFAAYALRSGASDPGPAVASPGLLPAGSVAPSSASAPPAVSPLPPADPVADPAADPAAEPPAVASASSTGSPSSALRPPAGPSAPETGAPSSPRPPAVPPLGHRPGPLRPSPPASDPPPATPTSAPAAPPKPRPPTDPFGGPI